MTTLYGGPVGPDFTDNQELTATAFNAVKDYWIVDELPETAEDGDVVFVVGEVAGGILPGLGGWAEITEVTGSPKRYAYNDDIDWVAFEWTDTSKTHTLTVTEGLMEALVVGGGSTNTNWYANSGGAKENLLIVNGSYDIVVGYGGYPQMGSRIGSSDPEAQQLLACTANVYGSGNTYPSDNYSNDGIWKGTVSHITGVEIEYARGSFPGDKSNTPGSAINTTVNTTNNDGVVVVRVPAEQAEKVDPGSWVTRSNNFAVVENGVVTETYTEHHYGNGTTTPLPQTDLIPCDANVTEGYSYENGEFVSPPAPEIPAAQQKILDKVNKLQEELRSYDV